MISGRLVLYTAGWLLACGASFLFSWYKGHWIYFVFGNIMYFAFILLIKQECEK